MGYKNNSLMDCGYFGVSPITGRFTYWPVVGPPITEPCCWPPVVSEPQSKPKFEVEITEIPDGD